MQHTERSGNRRWGSKSGFTLIELLVVVLIITILAIALLPALDPFITRAKYAADGIPMVGNIRTQVQLFQYEKEFLPGLHRLVDGTPIVNSNTNNATILTSLGNSQLHSSTNWQAGTMPGQTMSRAGILYRQAITRTTPTWNGTWTTNNVSDYNHYTVDLDLAAADFEGKNVRPENFVYMAMRGGYKDNNYAYAVGVFGDGEGIKSGTGFAVVEIYNKENTDRPKMVGTFRRWRPQYRKTECKVEQLNFALAGTENVPAIAGPFPLGNDADSLQELADNCWIDVGLMSTNSVDINAAIGNMRRAGWEF